MIGNIYLEAVVSRLQLANVRSANRVNKTGKEKTVFRRLTAASREINNSIKDIPFYDYLSKFNMCAICVRKYSIHFVHFNVFAVDHSTAYRYNDKKYWLVI